MNRKRLFIFYLLQWTWGIIQNVLGLFVMLFLFMKNGRRLKGDFYGSKITVWDRNDSASLGMFIFLSKAEVKRPMRVLVHEYGHCLQSCILGPLYMPLIGIPSFVWCNFSPLSRRRMKRGIRYSSFYPERWANHLGKKLTRLPSIDN